jgi:phosphopantetheinyl transferase
MRSLSPSCSFDTPSDYIAPRNSIEVRLAKIWGRILGKYSISIKDNFFDLGGTSALAIRLLAHIKREFQEHLPFSAIFEAQTIEEMGNLLTSRLSSSSPPLVRPLINIDSNSVHIWQADLNDFDSSKSIHWLSPLEQNRASRFSHPRDQHRYHASHIILRQILSSYQSQPLVGVPFETTHFGKPILTQTAVPHSLSFNMSHSDSRAYFIIGNSRDVGIDSEFASMDVFDDPTFCELAFNHRELETCAALPNEEKKQRLLRLWTFKEAYIKLKGKSLAYHLHEVAVPSELPLLSCHELHHLKRESISYWHQPPSDSSPYSITALADGCVSSIRIFDFHEHQRTFPVSV